MGIMELLATILFNTLLFRQAQSAPHCPQQRNRSTEACQRQFQHSARGSSDPAQRFTRTAEPGSTYCHSSQADHPERSSEGCWLGGNTRLSRPFHGVCPNQPCL